MQKEIVTGCFPSAKVNMTKKVKVTRLLLDGEGCGQQLTRHTICPKKFGYFLVACSIRQLVFLAFQLGTSFRTTAKGCAFSGTAAW